MPKGGCACGQVRFRLTDAPFFVNCCHCRDCQRSTGSAFAVNALIEWDRLELTGALDPEPEGRAAAAASGRWVACAACATALWGYIPMYRDAIRFVRAGALDEGERIVPDAHFFTRSRHPWVVLPAGARWFDTLPSADDPPLYPPAAAARLAAALRG